MAIRKRRVCLIDDDALVCAALEFTLRDQGFDVVVARDCTSGLNAALDSHAVLTDLNILGGDAIELISQLRLRQPCLQIVAMTGGSFRAGDDLAARAVETGAYVCLLKPFRPSELVRALSGATTAEAP